MRVATRAITSLPRLVPPAITTTALAASRAAITPEAVADPENRARSSESAWCTFRTPYAASTSPRSAGAGPTATASTGTPLPAADRARAKVTVSRETSSTPSALVST